MNTCRLLAQEMISIPTTQNTSPPWDVSPSAHCYKNRLMAQNKPPNGSVLKGTSLVGRSSILVFLRKKIFPLLFVFF